MHIRIFIIVIAQRRQPLLHVLLPSRRYRFLKEDVVGLSSLSVPAQIEKPNTAPTCFFFLWPGPPHWLQVRIGVAMRARSLNPG